jgi:hypothetical protein
LLLTLIAAALASGERNVRAIGRWVAEHAEELVAALAPTRGRLPSTATLRRALRAVDVATLEEQIAGVVAGVEVVYVVAGAAAPPDEVRLGPSWWRKSEQSLSAVTASAGVTMNAPSTASTRKMRSAEVGCRMAVSRPRATVGQPE